MIEANLNLFENTDWTVTFQFTDEDDVPWDFTGSTFRLDVKTSLTAGGASLSRVSGGGITHTDLVNGLITITFADFSLAVGSYVYDLIRITGAARETLMIGALTVEKGVTGL